MAALRCEIFASGLMFGVLLAVSAEAAQANDGSNDWSLSTAATPYRGETIRCVGDGYTPFTAVGATLRLGADHERFLVFDPETGKRIARRSDSGVMCI